MTTIDFSLSLPNAIKPIQATSGSAAVDLVSADLVFEDNNLIVNTGLRTAFSANYGLFIFSRSGYARKHGLSLVNGVAVIDSDYRGDIMLVFSRNCDKCSLAEAIDLLSPGKRVAQAILMPLPYVEWNQMDELQASDRGMGGFGSTGN